jgi:N-acetyl sugar amidotransferase
MRWSIETFFKFTKSYLKLGTEFQDRSFDMLISHTTVVFSRYLVMEFECRQENDAKSLGGLFFLFAVEVIDLDYQTALQQLMTLFLQIAKAQTKQEKSNVFLSTSRVDRRFAQLHQGFVHRFIRPCLTGGKMKDTIFYKGRELQICSRCIYDETISGISFDEEGICNYCHTMDNLLVQYQTGKPKGQEQLDVFIEQIKRDGKGKKYDCVIGVSGGTDSSFLLGKVLEWGLRPLAVHYDNTWNTAIATENIRKVLSKLNIDLFTYVVDNKEADDIFLSFMKAGVPELDASTDLALSEVMYRAASKYKVKYVIEGHSFVTEGIAPIGSMYFDGKYIKSIHKLFGRLSMKTYPLMDFASFMKWTLFKRIKKIRPFWYIDYSKEDAREYLQKEYDWQYYGGHHLENRITAMQHTYYNYQKFGIDNRNLSLSAAVRSGLMQRKEAIEAFYNQSPKAEEGLLDYFKERMNLTNEELENLMKIPNKTYKDYKTYKPLFEFLRPLFYLLAKASLVPMSFYLKYTSKDNDKKKRD